MKYLRLAPAGPNTRTAVAGAWARQRVGGEAGSISWLSKESGLAALQLSTSATATEGLHDVKVLCTSRAPLHQALMVQQLCAGAFLLMLHEQALSAVWLWLCRVSS